MNIRSVAAILLCALCIGCGSHQSAQFQLYSLDGKKTFALKDYSGKVLVLDFWATWCQPCKMVQPVVKGWAEKYADKGVEVLGVTEEAPSLVTDFINKTPLGYPAVLDRGDEVNTLFNVDSYPTLLIFDKGGSVAYQGSPFQTEKVVAVLNKLTEGK